jgi:DNA polymerase-3 subunit gamma/tau
VGLVAYVVLARKWRPNTFDEVVGQQHVCQTLRRALELKRLSHAYLFSGPRGVGKTTVARILAKALNCDQGPGPDPCNTCPSCQDIAGSRGFDVLEIDGASHRGIDEIRTLRENVRYAPTQGKHKVYIIDEVHMLTTEAFNALLKTLEEPPPQVVFVFATTEPHKVPPTIASRCQRFEFRKIPSSMIRQRLQKIAAAEDTTVTDEALGLIARRADGSMRDAEGLLDQAIAFAEGPVTPKHLQDLLGGTGQESATALLARIIAHDARGVLAVIDDSLQAGTDPGQLAQGFGDFLRDLLLVKVGAETDSVQTISDEQRKRLVDAGSDIAEEDLIAMLTLWAPVQRELRTSPQPRLSLELAALKLAKQERAAGLREVLDRLREVEQLMLEGETRDSVVLQEDAGGSESESTGDEPEAAAEVSEPAARTEPELPPPASEAPRAEPERARSESGAPEAAAEPAPPPPEAIDEQPATEQRQGIDGKAQLPDSEPGSVAPTPWTVDRWPAVVEELKADSTHFAALLYGTRLEEAQPGRYVILFPERHTWHMKQVQAPEYLPVIVQILSHHTGRKVELMCRLKPGLLVDEPVDVPAEPQDPVTDPSVTKVIQLFRGSLQGYERTEREGPDES